MRDDRSIDVLRLDVVGAGPAFTDKPGATGAAYLARCDGSAVLLDLGQGSFPRLAGLLDPAGLDAIFISHLHPDHFIDLVSLRHYLRWGPGHPGRVRVIGPDGLADRLDALHAEPGFTAAALDVEPLQAGLIQIGSMFVEAAPVFHTDASFAFRVSGGNGAGLVYSGDCGRASDLEQLLRPGDVLLAEVSFGSGPVPQGAAHLDGPAVGSVAARAGASRVLLTHLLMSFDERATIQSVESEFRGPVQLVNPGDGVTIGG